MTISSIAAQIAVPFQGSYSAGKAAVEALAYAVRPYGLDVVIVEPGNIATTIAQSRRVTDAARAKSAYPQTASGLDTMASEEHAGPDPQVVARLAAKVLAARAHEGVCSIVTVAFVRDDSSTASEIRSVSNPSLMLVRGSVPSMIAETKSSASRTYEASSRSS